MTKQDAAPIVLKLRAFPSTSGTFDATYRPPRQRVTSALLTLLGFLLVTPLVALVPPHIPWALGAVVVGLYMAYRRWTGEFVVHNLEATCPSCGKPLTIKRDQYVRLPHTIPCYNCHQEPELQLAS